MVGTEGRGRVEESRAGEGGPWFLRPEAVGTLRWVFGVLLVGLVALDFAVKHYQHFGVDGTFGFYPWYAFLSCALAVVIAKVLAIFLKRDEDYYGPEGEPGEPGALAHPREETRKGEDA